MRKLFLMLCGAVLVISFNADISAQNKPCSGKKGGVSHCENGKFVCKDGSVSKSKKVCGTK